MIKKTVFAFTLIIFLFNTNAYAAQAVNSAQGVLEIENKTNKDVDFTIFIPDSKFIETHAAYKASTTRLMLPLLWVEKVRDGYKIALDDYKDEQFFYLKDAKKLTKIRLKEEYKEVFISVNYEQLDN